MLQSVEDKLEVFMDYYLQLRVLNMIHFIS